MPWNDQSNGGGPWGSGGGQGPWGQSPRGPQRGGGGGQPPPDLDELIRQFQARWGGLFGGGGGGGRGGGISSLLVMLLAFGLIAWVAWPGSGWFIVQAQEQGVVLRFGEPRLPTAKSGFHLKLPTPIETVTRVPVEREQVTEIGFRSLSANQVQDSPTESLMLTGDENIVDIDFQVGWRVRDPIAYLFNVKDPVLLVKSSAESAMREVVGGRKLEPIITTEREEVESEARALLQTLLDRYESGILVRRLQLKAADPPARVRDAFLDVAGAEQDAQALINQATAYRNDVVPKARGDAAQLVQQAEGYRDKVIADSNGEAQRFALILAEYQRAPEVTRRRMYLETMEKVLSRSEKIVVDGEAGPGVVPYLPLDQLRRAPTGSAQGGR